MNKIGKNFKVVIILLLALIMSCGFAKSGDGESNDFAYEQDSADTNRLHELVELKPEVITTKGILPKMTTDTEEKEWFDLLVKAYGDFPEIEQYFIECGGPMSSYGFAGEGYIEIGFDIEYSENVNESIITEIYRVINDHYEKEGIKDVPVVFVWTHIVETVEVSSPSTKNEGVSVLNDDGSVTTYTADEAYIDEHGNVVIIDNESTSESNVQNTPDFTSIMLILFLLILVKSRK